MCQVYVQKAETTLEGGVGDCLNKLPYNMGNQESFDLHLVL